MNNNINSNYNDFNKSYEKSTSNKKLHFSFFDKIILLKIAPRFSRARKEKIDEIFFKGSEYIMNNLNVINFLKRNYTADLESKLLMSEEQTKIFDYISKPILSLSFLGSRYNLRHLPIKIKQKLLARNSIIEQIKQENNFIDNFCKENDKNTKISDKEGVICEDISQSQTD